jgi:hypothetical protein
VQAASTAGCTKRSPAARAAPAALTLSQLRLGSFVAKAPYPSPLKGEGPHHTLNFISLIASEFITCPPIRLVA